MSLTKRGKIFTGVAALAIGIVAVSAVLALAGKSPPVLRDIGKIVGIHEPAPPPTCPLTGVETKAVPDRPVLAIKVENLPEARPQAGMGKADIVYEEPVEGGITRFIVLYQCRDSERIGPVRSARLTDAPILVQYGTPIFGYAGGVPPVVASIRDAGIDDQNYNIAISAYTRDPNRPMPHNLYTSTKALYEAAKATGAPESVFEYSDDLPDHTKPAKTAHLDFSASSDVYWEWNGRRGLWLRSHGDEPHLLEGDVQVSAKNVVVQLVGIKYTGISDVAGSPSPEAITVGHGKAYIFRGGRLIVGTWRRDNVDDVTTFETLGGDTIELAPGNTWIELYPNDRPPVEANGRPLGKPAPAA